ncbi:MAG: UvrD-helicase domain-containing protein [Candidatus Delongbacteria bacterium]|nr:UvrD-helicase domain-containing protein [Candidatus Delongbacteria bacterium]MBN2837112.1 UvrD-helicase domain-containing protein [Candidatus Delongbacteria bacterium]
MFNKSQQEAVDHFQGPCLVLAGAGSGKTRVITGRIEKLIFERKINPENILAMTFTNKAAGEMAERIKDQIGIENSRGLVCTTFHSFCVRVLKEFIKLYDKRYKPGFSIYTSNEQIVLIKKAMHNLNIGEEYFDPKLVLWKISSIKTRGIDIENMEIYDPLSSVAKRVVKEYSTLMANNNALDFDDLLNMVDKLLRTNEDVRLKLSSRYKFLLVDEFQDTNNVQYRIVKSLAKDHGNLFVVGDDDQSIYGFRGANFENILQFDRDWSKCKVVILNTNYRSSSTILDAANAVIGNNTMRKSKEVNAFNKEGEKIYYFEGDDEKDEAQNIILKIMDKGYKSYNETAILIRANYQARPLEEALREKKIPYNLVGGMKFFDRAEVKDLIAYLTILVNPSDEVSLTRIIDKPARGIGDETIFKISDFAEKNEISLFDAMRRYKEISTIRSTYYSNLENFVALVENGMTIFGKGELYNSYNEFVDSTGYRDFLKSKFKDKSLESKLSSLEELGRSIESFANDNPKSGLDKYLVSISLSQDSDDIDLNKGVKIMTVHSSKGLEFDTVFIAGVEENVFPHERSLEENNVEEERRLFYVAITRARKELYISISRQRKRGKETIDTTKSRFIDEIPNHLFELAPEGFGEMSIQNSKSKISALMEKLKKMGN